MNKFKEFDYIQTPLSWKEDILNHSCVYHKRIFSQKLILACLLILLSISSLGIVYAYNEDFQLWVHNQFEDKIIGKAPELNMNKQWLLEDYFLYYYKEIDDNEKIITDVYYFDNGEFIKKDIQHLRGSYKNQAFEFDYVRCGKDIFTFHHKGYVEYTIPMLKNDLLYFGSADNNLCSFDMKTNEIKKITNDNKSVNFTMSPKQTYIMINKSDEYWTIYNTDTKEEIRFDDLNGYALNNEYAFIDDSHLLYFSSLESTSLLNLKTMKIKKYNKLGWYPIISTMCFEDEENKIVIENFMTKQKRILPYKMSEYNWYVFKNRYIIFESVKFDKIIFYDFETGKEKVLDYRIEKEENDGGLSHMILDESYLIIGNSKEYYIVKI